MDAVDAEQVVLEVATIDGIVKCIEANPRDSSRVAHEKAISIEHFGRSAFDPRCERGQIVPDTRNVEVAVLFHLMDIFSFEQMD